MLLKKSPKTALVWGITKFRKDCGTHAHWEEKSMGKTHFIASADSPSRFLLNKDRFDGRQRDGDKWHFR